MTEFIKDVLAIVGVISVPLDIVTFVWARQERQRAKKERQRTRDFISKAKVWVDDAGGISNQLSKLKSDCEQGKVSTVQEASGRVDTIGSGVYTLFASLKDALKETKTDER
ncbi:MAG: hypothetical protein WBW48_21565 [Anaerolineae bacterium]